MDEQKIFYISGIIVKSLQDELTDRERADLQSWVEESPEHAEMLEEFSHYTFLEKKSIAKCLCGKEKAYRQFCLRQIESRRRKALRRWKFLSVAALAVVMLAVAGGLFFRQGDAPESLVAQEVLSAGKSCAVLTLTDGSRMNLGKQLSDTLLQSEGAVLNSAAGQLVYHSTGAQARIVVYNQLDIPRKGEYMLVLSDGTRVWLNAESRLKYPVVFQGKERKVYLEGEAYFEVTRNERMPFIVASGETAVEVLGTSFNMRAYADESCIYTTLVEGRVRLASGRESMVLQPNEQGVVNPVSGTMDKRTVDVALYTSWKDGRFVFENQTLEEIMLTFSRWYDVNVFFTNDRVKAAMFNGNLKRYEEFGKVVEMLELTGVAHFEINGNTIVISE